MKKTIQLMWIVSAVILFLLPFPLHSLLKNHIDTQNHENRELAQRPELNLSELEAYPEGFDNWLNDNLPFRNQLIAYNSLISVKMFGESPSEKVVIGRDGYLFYSSTLPDFQGTNLFSDWDLEAFRSNLIKTRDKLKEQGIEFVVFIAPNKSHIYPDKMADKYGQLTEYTRARQLCDYMKDEDIRIVFADEELIQARKDYPQYEFYPRLDTHWNNLGAYVGAKTLLSELGHDMPDIDSLKITESDTIPYDLANMIHLWGYLKEDINYDLSGYCERTPEVLEYDDSSIYRYKTEEADERKIMIIRDSYSTALAPFVAGEFNDTVFCHRDSYDTSLIDKEQPDIVVYECVERYLYILQTFQITDD